MVEHAHGKGEVAGSIPAIGSMINYPGVLTDVILAPYTTYKIGGPADYFFIARNRQDLIEIIKEARDKKINYFILGTGANILISDSGFRGLVIKNEFNDISINNEQVTASSGVLIGDLISKTLDCDLSGLEHFVGIPSTVGGAIWQNLHFLSPDRSRTIFIEEFVESAEILDEESNLIKVDKDFFNFNYDESILHHRNLIVIEVCFNLLKSNKEIIQKQIENNLKWRSDKQPPVELFPSCGSVFKKVLDVGAGRLIDQVGLKGYCVGDAVVSEKHANFIVNKGKATAKDVCALIDIIKDKVLKETGYSLETEIGFIGEFN